MPNFAVVENGKVINIVVWDGVTEWKPDSGEAIIAPDGVGVGVGWLYADGVFTAPAILEQEKTHDELVLIAEAEKNARINDAKSKIIVWQTKLLMGRTLTESEASALNAWVDYIDAVSEIDTNTAPDISWPEKPQ